MEGQKEGQEKQFNDLLIPPSSRSTVVLEIGLSHVLTFLHNAAFRRITYWEVRGILLLTRYLQSRYTWLFERRFREMTRSYTRIGTASGLSKARASLGKPSRRSCRIPT